MTQLRFFLTIIFSFSAFLSLKAKEDSIQIRNFEASVYKAHQGNYMGIETDDGTLYFANENGVLVYNGSKWRLIPTTNFSAVSALLQVKDRIYVGGINELGYLQPDQDDNFKYVSLRHLINLEKGEEFSTIWQLAEYKGDIYFQAYEMILRYDGRHMHRVKMKNAWIFKFQDHLLTSPFTTGGIYKIEKDSAILLNPHFQLENDAGFQVLPGLKGEHLLLTENHGIFLLNSETYATISWDAEANKLFIKKSLYNGKIWRDSLYAFTTYSEGLFVVNKEGKLVEHYTQNNGLLSNHLCEMVLDRRGNLWLPGLVGLSYLYTEKFPPDTQLKTFVDFISLKDQNFYVKGKNNLTTPEDYAGSIIFHFATPGYHREELNYSYYLEGYEKSWSKWNDEVKKEYTNLGAGNYTFHVKARYKNNLESVPVSVKVIIPQVWYKTKIALFCWLVLLVIFIILCVRLRTKKLKEKNKKLEAIIEERTKELVEQKEQLLLKNKELSILNAELDNFVYRSSHDLVAPLKSLKGLVNIAQLENKNETQANYLNLMATSITKLENFIKKIMEYSSNDKKEISWEEIDFNEIIDSILEDLTYYKGVDKIHFIRNICTKEKLFSDSRRLNIVLSNLITNSIKYHNYYQSYLFIKISTLVNNDEYIIEISDNGRGIEKEYVNDIFNMFFRASESAEGSGLGLYIVKDTIEKLGGRIKVDSVFGKGTVFTISFPFIGDLSKAMNYVTSMEKEQEAN